MLELERLLALAKVGTHELQSGETSPELRFPTETASKNDQQHHAFAQQLREACQSAQSDAEGNNSDNEVVVETCDSADELVEETDQPTTVMLDTPADSESSSGVLVEIPSDDEGVVVSQAEGSHAGPRPLAIVETPKFRFYSDEKAVPQQLSGIQLQSLRNRHAFQSRLHDVECRLAMLTAQLADEEMALQRDIQTAVTDCIYQPVQTVLEHASLQSETSLNQRWLTLEQKCSTLDASITHGIHVRLRDLRQDTASVEAAVDSLSEQMHATALLADTKDVAQARRWEAQVGTMARRLHEETAARAATLGSMDEKLHKLDPHRGQELLDVIRSLRTAVDMEREERIASDDQIREYILSSTESMKQAILGVYDPDVEEF